MSTDFFRFRVNFVVVMTTLKSLSLEEVKKHSQPDDLWVVIHDKVYDLTQFAKEVS